MKYKLNPEIRLIKCPVILKIDDKEYRYPNGVSMTVLEFDRHYVVDSIMARNNSVVVILRENSKSTIVNWIGEAAVGLM